MFSDAVPSDDVLDAACFFIRSAPEDPATGEMKKTLVHLYGKRGQFDKALHYAQSAGIYSPRYLKKLNDRLARKLFLLILQNPDPQMKTERLSRLIAEFPQAPIVKQARKELGRLALDSLFEFRISRAELMTYPELRLHTGLDLDPAYVDGRLDDGELTEEGILAVKGGPLLYRLVGSSGDHEIDMTPEQRDLLRLRLQEIRSGSSLKEETASGGKEKPFPLEIAGGIGSRGVEAYPSFAPIPYQQDDLDLYK